MNDVILFELKAFIDLLLHDTMFSLNHEHFRLFARKGMGRDVFHYVMAENKC
jgi:hypothetical protein